MAVGLGPLPELFPVKGVRLSSVEAGIRYANRNDLVLMEFESGSVTAGVFTRNAFCAAPVVVAKDHLAQSSVRAFVINSGNANAGTGEQGLEAALETCRIAAARLSCKESEVLPFSTGVIGEHLPVDKIATAMPCAVEGLDANAWSDAARAIMTTDTVPKAVSKQVELDGKVVTVTGMAKGSGMIRPDMATMLAYIATDIAMPKELLQESLYQAVEQSFNRITVDGDTSTNDACMLVATGQSGVEIKASGEQLESFNTVIAAVCQELAQSIIRDGEGVTKFITIRVEQGGDQQECLDVAYTIAHSPLVKTAFFASDPNWGRILAAIGRAGVDNLDIDNIEVYLDEVCIVEEGGRSASYTEEAGQKVMDQEEITIRVVLKRGEAVETVWTTDLSHDYVKINAEYRT